LGSCASKKITDVSYLLSSKESTNGAEDEHFMPRNSKLKQLPVLILYTEATGIVGVRDL
jgi:hypothetical protein